MDAADVCPGNTVYLPVNVPGAMLYIGDGHAAQGDGEVCGVATEIPTRGTLRPGRLLHHRAVAGHLRNIGLGRRVRGIGATVTVAFRPSSTYSVPL